MAWHAVLLAVVLAAPDFSFAAVRSLKAFMQQFSFPALNSQIPNPQPTVYAIATHFAPAPVLSNDQ